MIRSAITLAALLGLAAHAQDRQWPSITRGGHRVDEKQITNSCAREIEPQLRQYMARQPLDPIIRSFWMKHFDRIASEGFVGYPLTKEELQTVRNARDKFRSPEYRKVDDAFWLFENDTMLKCLYRAAGPGVGWGYPSGAGWMDSQMFNENFAVDRPVEFQYVDDSRVLKILAHRTVTEVMENGQPVAYVGEAPNRARLIFYAGTPDLAY